MGDDSAYIIHSFVLPSSKVGVISETGITLIFTKMFLSIMCSWCPPKCLIARVGSSPEWFHSLSTLVT